MTAGAHAVLAFSSAQQVAGHVLDGGEVRGCVLAPDAALIVAKHHIHHPVQDVLDGPVAAHGMACL